MILFFSGAVCEPVNIPIFFKRENHENQRIKNLHIVSTGSGRNFYYRGSNNTGYIGVFFSWVQSTEEHQQHNRPFIHVYNRAGSPE